MIKLVFGKPFLLWHKSGHSPLPCLSVSFLQGLLFFRCFSNETNRSTTILRFGWGAEKRHTHLKQLKEGDPFGRKIVRTGKPAKQNTQRSARLQQGEGQGDGESFSILTKIPVPNHTINQVKGDLVQVTMENTHAAPTHLPGVPHN